jgi:hypothetical protein
VRAVLAYDDQGQPHVFVVREPARNDFATMTLSARIPALAGITK